MREKILLSVRGARTRYGNDLKNKKKDNKKLTLKRKKKRIIRLSAETNRLSDESEYLLRLGDG